MAGGGLWLLRRCPGLVGAQEVMMSRLTFVTIPRGLAIRHGMLAEAVYTLPPISHELRCMAFI